MMFKRIVIGMPFAVMVIVLTFIAFGVERMHEEQERVARAALIDAVEAVEGALARDRQLPPRSVLARTAPSWPVQSTQGPAWPRSNVLAYEQGPGTAWRITVVAFKENARGPRRSWLSRTPFGDLWTRCTASSAKPTVHCQRRFDNHGRLHGGSWIVELPD